MAAGLKRQCPSEAPRGRPDATPAPDTLLKLRPPRHGNPPSTPKQAAGDVSGWHDAPDRERDCSQHQEHGLCLPLPGPHRPERAWSNTPARKLLEFLLGRPPMTPREHAASRLPADISPPLPTYSLGRGRRRHLGKGRPGALWWNRCLYPPVKPTRITLVSQVLRILYWTPSTKFHFNS